MAADAADAALCGVVLNLKNAVLVLADRDYPDGSVGLTLTIRHGGTAFRMEIGADDRRGLVGWLVSLGLEVSKNEDA